MSFRSCTESGTSSSCEHILYENYCRHVVMTIVMMVARLGWQCSFGFASNCTVQANLRTNFTSWKEKGARYHWVIVSYRFQLKILVGRQRVGIFGREMTCVGCIHCPLNSAKVIGAAAKGVAIGITIEVVRVCADQPSCSYSGKANFRIEIMSLWPMYGTHCMGAGWHLWIGLN